MNSRNFNQTSNVTYISSANNTYAIKDNDDSINVNTTFGATILQLQSISGAGLLLNPRTIYITDFDGSASTNTITINCNGTDTINGASSLVINTNNGSVAIQVSSFNEWIATGSGAGGGGVTSVGLQIGTTGSNINVSNSPITSSGNITLNIPNASGTTTGRLTSTDWNAFNGKVNGVGSSNFISKWNSPGTLISSIIQDDNVRLGISTPPTSQNKVYISNTIDDSALTILSSKNSTGTTWGINSTISNTNAGGSAIGLNINATGRINSYGISSFLSGGIAGTTQVGGYFEAGNSSNALTNIGLIAIANTTAGGTRYSVRLQDGTQATDRLLKSVDTQGNANWTDIKTINGTSVLGSGNIVAGAPAWLESDATDLTIWNNGKGNLSGNTSYGEGTLRSVTSGNNNTGIGYQSLYNVTSGNGGHAALGYQSLYSVSTSGQSVGVGYQAGYGATSDYVVAIGYRAQFAACTWPGIVAIGSETLRNSTTQSNTGVGFNVLRTQTTGFANTGVGYNSIYSNTTGSRNVGTGNNTLYQNTTGSNNTAVGDSSLQSNSIGNFNTAIGSGTLGSATSNNNTALGYQSLLFCSSGSNNTGVGYQSLYSATSGNGGSTALGYQALYTQTVSGDYNIGIGYQAGYGTQSAPNISIGYRAQYTASATGANNTAIGYESLYFNQANNNTSVGYQTNRATTTGQLNSSFGILSQTALTTGSFNSGFGAQSLVGLTTGSNNTAVGRGSISNNSTGGNNSVLGAETSCLNYSDCVILGYKATATANNQFVVGSSTNNSGTVSAEVNSSSNVWNVIINGVARKILLA